jgi:hypothetical protein
MFYVAAIAQRANGRSSRTNGFRYEVRRAETPFQARDMEARGMEMFATRQEANAARDAR